MRTKELQLEIKNFLTEMNWSVAEASRRVYCEENDSENDDDPEEIRRYTEAFKKWLTRPTTRPKRLERVLAILHNQRDAQKVRTVKPSYVPSTTLDQNVQREMRAISRMIDQELKDDES